MSETTTESITGDDITEKTANLMAIGHRENKAKYMTYDGVTIVLQPSAILENIEEILELLQETDKFTELLMELENYVSRSKEERVKTYY